MICFLILTELTSFVLSFVLWSVRVLGKDSMDYGIRSGKSLSLGMSWHGSNTCFKFSNFGLICCILLCWCAVMISCSFSMVIWWNIISPWYNHSRGLQTYFDMSLMFIWVGQLMHVPTLSVIGCLAYTNEAAIVHPWKRRNKACEMLFVQI